MSALELSDFVGKPCNSRIAYEFVPRKATALNMVAAARHLRENDVFIEIETPALVMLKIAGTDVSLFRSGKIIVKSTSDKQKAKEIAQKVIDRMNWKK